MNTYLDAALRGAVTSLTFQLGELAERQAWSVGWTYVVIAAMGLLVWIV